MAKKFTEPISTFQRLFFIDDGLRAAHDKLNAKKKLTLVLRFNIYPSDVFKTGDSIQMLIHDGKAKRGSWTFPR